MNDELFIPQIGDTVRIKNWEDIPQTGRNRAIVLESGRIYLVPLDFKKLAGQEYVVTKTRVDEYNGKPDYVEIQKINGQMVISHISEPVSTPDEEYDTSAICDYIQSFGL